MTYDYEENYIMILMSQFMCVNIYVIKTWVGTWFYHQYYDWKIMIIGIGKFYLIFL